MIDKLDGLVYDVISFLSICPICIRIREDHSLPSLHSNLHSLPIYGRRIRIHVHNSRGVRSIRTKHQRQPQPRGQPRGWTQGQPHASCVQPLWQGQLREVHSRKGHHKGNHKHL